MCSGELCCPCCAIWCCLLRTAVHYTSTLHCTSSSLLSYILQHTISQGCTRDHARPRREQHSSCRGRLLGHREELFRARSGRTTRAHQHTNTRTHTHTDTDTDTDTHTHRHTQTQTHTHTKTQKHTKTHKHTHTHTNTLK